MQLRQIPAAVLSGVLAVVALPSNAAERSLDPKLLTDLAAKEFVSLEERVREQCESDLADATSTEKTLSQRAAAAAEAMRCVERRRALLSAKAGDAETRAAVKESLQPLTREAGEAKAQSDAETTFMGLSWGLGFGYSFGSDEAIDGAEIVNGVVRATSKKEQQPRVLLEFHKYFWCNSKVTDGTRGCGPFVAVATTQDKVLSGVGMGAMYGWRVKKTDSDGFSIGVGAILDGKVKDLGDGFKENKAPPAGETEVRFKEEARWSALLFVTRTF